ncbi:MAG: Dabb family protein [Candidatus Nanopelagicales bacterium]
MITHVVSFTFADRADREECRDRLEALVEPIDALLTLTVGLDLLGDNGAADLVLISTHDDAAGLRAYQQHPDHVEFAAWLKPRITSRTVVDFES